MKYVITGAAGHISRPITEILLASGHQVTVIGRNAENLKVVTDKGAKAAIGSIEDVNFLKEAFAGADAVYTMIPPTITPSDWKAYIHKVGKGYAEAMKATGVKYVVNLSSVGAHRPDGCGPVSGLHRAEQELNTLSDVNILHLRPGFFFDNFLSLVPLAKHNNIVGGNYGDANATMIFSNTDDIAEAAAEELLNLRFKGHSVRYLASDERSFGDVAKSIGNAIGNPSLPWVEFTDEQTNEAMIAAGLPKEIADNYTEMGAGIRTGIMQEDFRKNPPAQFGKHKLEDFGLVFAAAYNA